VIAHTQESFFDPTRPTLDRVFFLGPLLQGGATPCKNQGESVEAVRKNCQKRGTQNHSYYKAPKRFQPFPPFQRAKIKKRAYQTLNKLLITIVLLNILTYGN
jgi:hypothetical protein